jgi:hypothetical protein
MNLCEELKVQLRLPSIIMEDNSACNRRSFVSQEVQTLLNADTLHQRASHHRGDKNAADLLTKRLRGSDFQTKGEADPWQRSPSSRRRRVNTSGDLRPVT